MSVPLPDLPAGFSARPHTMADAAIVAALVGDCELFEDGLREMEAADITAFWSVPSLDLEPSSVAVFEGDRLVATGDVHDEYGSVDVHPDVRGRGIGSALLPWTWAQVRAQGGRRVGQILSDARTDGEALFSANGYDVMWSSWILRMPIQDLREPTLPIGYTMHDLDYATDAREVCAVIDTAFDEWRGRPSEGWEGWDGFVGNHANLAPWASRVLRHEGRIVGATISFDYGPEQDAWINQLAVERSHRGKGLGRALIHASFARFASRGHTHGGLGADTRSGALAFYEHVGMRVRTSSKYWEKQLSG